MSPHSPLHGIGVTAADLADHEFRYEQLEFNARFVPPLSGGLLVGRHHQFGASPRREIARNCRLDVNRWFHPG